MVNSISSEGCLAKNKLIIGLYDNTSWMFYSFASDRHQGKLTVKSTNNLRRKPVWKRIKKRDAVRVSERFSVDERDSHLFKAKIQIDKRNRGKRKTLVWISKFVIRYTFYVYF